MARVKHGKDVKNKSDLQNVVIGIINRMQEEFTRDKIIEMVDYNLKGSEFYGNLKLIEKVVEENLSFLYRVGFINCWNGKYSPQEIG